MEDKDWTKGKVMSERWVWKSRWAAIGAAIAVSIGGGGIFFAQAAGGTEGSTVMIDPVRIMDTRNGVDVGLPGPFVSAVSQKLQVSGSVATTTGTMTPVPTGATGVLLNVTVVSPSAAGFLSVRPGDATGAPATSSLNFSANATVPNAVTVALPTAGTDAGRIIITFDALGVAGPTTDVLIDVVGYTIDTKLAALQAQVDALNTKVAPLVNSVAAFAGGNQLIGLTSTDVIVRSVSLMPPADGTVIVNSSANLLRSSGAAGARCSITLGTVVETGFLQIAYMPDIINAAAVLAGTRGYPATRGVLLKVNLVCVERFPEVQIRDSSLTAIFAPT